MFMFSVLIPRMNGKVVSHEADSNEHLLRITKTYFENFWGANWVLTPNSYAANKIGWKENSSRITVATAKNKEAARSQTVRFIHGSEVAFWPDPGSLTMSLFNTLPRQPLTFFFLESTANGVGDYFHTTWKAAKEGEVEYKPLFFAWWQHPLYTWTEGYGFGRELPKDRVEQIMATLTDDERKILKQKRLVRWTPKDQWVQEERWGTPRLVWENSKLVGTERATEGMREEKVAGKRRGGKMVWKRVGVGMQPVTVNQLAWRRSRLEDKDMEGNVRKFDQDYPWCPEVAFMASGNPVFDPDWVNAQIDKARSIPVAFRGWIVEADATPS
jgi:hypothetical protein